MLYNLLNLSYSEFVCSCPKDCIWLESITLSWFPPTFLITTSVENNLLSDYKVVILAVDEGLVSSNLQKSLEDGSELKLTDATKIIGVYKA